MTGKMRLDIYVRAVHRYFPGFLRAVWNHIRAGAEDFHLLSCVYSGRPAVFTQSIELKWNKKRTERGKWLARHCLARIAIDMNNVERLTEGDGQIDLFRVAYFRLITECPFRSEI